MFSGGIEREQQQEMIYSSQLLPYVCQIPLIQQLLDQILKFPYFIIEIFTYNVDFHMDKKKSQDKDIILQYLSIQIFIQLTVHTIAECASKPNSYVLSFKLYGIRVDPACTFKGHGLLEPDTGQCFYVGC